MSSLSVGSAIREMLLQSEEIKKLVGDKIYPVLSQDETDFPYIVYQRSGISPTYTKDRHAAEDTLFLDVVAMASGYSESLEIIEAVRSALEKKRGAYSGIKISDIRIVDSVEQGQDDFGQGLSLEIDCK